MHAPLSFTHVWSPYEMPGTVWHWEHDCAVTDVVPGRLSCSAAPLGLYHAFPPAWTSSPRLCLAGLIPLTATLLSPPSPELRECSLTLSSGAPWLLHIPLH